MPDRVSDQLSRPDQITRGLCRLPHIATMAQSQGYGGPEGTLSRAGKDTRILLSKY